MTPQEGTRPSVLSGKFNVVSFAIHNDGSCLVQNRAYLALLGRSMNPFGSPPVSIVGTQRLSWRLSYRHEAQGAATPPSMHTDCIRACEQIVDKYVFDRL